MSNTHERGEYEKEREQNIKRNSDFLRTLGMDEDTAALRAAAAADKRARKRPKTNKPAHTAPPKRSPRNEGKVVKYTFDLSDRKLGIARESRPRGPGTVVWDNTAVPDAEKAEAATARAEVYAAQSEHANTERVCVKQLLKSHISGGFWLQLPSHFCKCMPDTILNPTPQVLFDLKGFSGEGLPKEVPDGDVWEAIWLPKGGGGGGGLSGGWRGFSLDNNLAFGDTIVFEKQEGHVLHGTIFRAVPLAENAEFLARDPAEVAKVAAEVEEARSKGRKRRYSTMTIRENTERNALADAAAAGVPHRKKKQQAKSASKTQQRGVGGKEQKKSWAAVARAAAEAEAAEGGGGGGDVEEYVVERLLDTRRRAGVREYHVKWYGYDAEEDMTWEMESNLNDLLTDYDGYKEQVWHKLSAVEKAAHAKQSGAQVKAKPLKAKPLKAKPKPKPKAPKNGKEQPPEAKPQAQAKGSRGPKAVSASSSSAPPDTFPAVGERVEVKFTDQFYVGITLELRQTKAKKGQKAKPGWQFLVHFDADNEKVWIGEKNTWRRV